MIQVAAVAQVPQNSDLVDMQLSSLGMEQVAATTQLVNLEASKVSIERQLKDATGPSADALRNRLSETVGAIAGQKAKLADLKARIAELQGATPKTPTVGVATTPPEFFLQPPRSSMFGMNKDEFLGIFILLLTMPIVIAVSRRLWIRSTPKKAEQPAIETDRLQRLEQMVEAVAIEVERIGESQRFQSKLMAEKRPEPKRVNTPH